MAKVRKFGYAGLLVFPALLCAPGCGGDPPKTPEGVQDVSIEDLEAGATTGIELGTETDSALEPEGESHSTTPDTDASESGE